MSTLYGDHIVRCGAKKRQGEGNCTHVAGWGTDHVGIGKCRLHGGNTTAHRRHAARTAGERIAESLDIEPHDALLANLAAWNGVVAFFTDAIKPLEDTVVRYRRERSVRVDGDDADGDRVFEGAEYLTTVETSNEARLHILVQERHVALQERGKAAKLCVDAKVEERIVAQAERDGQMLALFAGAILDGLDMRGDPRAPEIVRQAFQVIEGGKAA